ncbi:zinc finger MYM-type protein 1-like [Capsicum annuum]|uniref:zinc finger MYM-type protein 1-like n=1 Tax=Capsicum annuum TaxID=4072 RepID=UPI001FB16FE7|nr:zinc finger MYM-type protein 1-like [Capsicum annuum]
MREEQSIEAAFYKWDKKSKNEYRVRLNASIDVVQFLLNQGLALRGHDESESSLNKGNFLEALSWLSDRCDDIKPYVLEKAPKNNKIISHDIQKDIVIACKIETIKAIIKDLDGDYFALLVDESRDVSRKEQMTIYLRYVDKKGFAMETFIGLVHVKDTSVLSLKKTIVDVLAHHYLTLAYVRGQCYDAANNMQGELVLSISNTLIVLGASFKRVDEFRESQKEKLQKALDMDELERGRGLNQEHGLIKVSDTRWGSHHKSFENFISNFAFIVDVLDSLVKNASTSEEKAIESGFLRSCQTFEIVFLLHLMIDILEITTDLNVSLQILERDIANALILLQEVNDRFNEVTSYLLNDMACLNPIDTFSSFDIKKILVMAKLYPDDFEFNMRVLENQLVNYIIDVREIDKRFSNLGGVGEHARKLVETKKHLSYPLVFLLVTFALPLLVVTASVERAFSAMKYIKNDLRNQIDDEFLDVA